MKRELNLWAIIDRVSAIARAYTDDDTARALGVSVKTLAEVKAGRHRPYARLIDFAQRYDVSIEWLLYGFKDDDFLWDTPDLYCAADSVIGYVLNRIQPDFPEHNPEHRRCNMAMFECLSLRIEHHSPQNLARWAELVVRILGISP